MNKNGLFLAVASAALTAGLGAGQSMAQDIDSNFNRNTSVSVTDRAAQNHPEEGIPVGAFLLLPTIAATAGYNDNVYYVATGKQSDSFFELAPSAEISSRWSRNMLSAGFKTDFIDYSKFSSENESNWNIHAAGRYDISSQANIFGNISHAHSFEGRDSYQSDLTQLKPVQYDTDTGLIGIVLTGNRLRFTGTVQSMEDTFKNVPAANAAGFDLETTRNDRNDTFSGRLDYALSPDVSIYATAFGNTHHYPNLAQYNSKGSTFAVGSSFDLTHLIRGQFEIGGVTQNYSDTSLGKQSSGYFNGTVNWFPTELTTVTGSANRSFSDTPYLGAQVTSINTSGSLGVDHELLRDLILQAKIAESKYQYKGINRDDKVDIAMVGAKYYVGRRIYISGTLNHEKYSSSGAQAYRNFTDNVFRVTLGFSY